MSQTLGRLIKLGRENQSLSRRDLAMALSVSPQLVAAWESGERIPTTVTLAPLSLALDIPVAMFALAAQSDDDDDDEEAAG